MAVWMLLVSGSCRDTTEICPLPNYSAKGVLAKPLQYFPIRPSLTATLLLLSQFVTVWAWRVRSILGVEGQDKSKEYRPHPEMQAAEVYISRKQYLAEEGSLDPCRREDALRYAATIPI